ncbi:spore cortex-lytic enzyme [Schinkia azotoformans MEV2011]|uniref:Spore cortex-lytic enzyme n=1 Tax=Schinkia azotoformans MEV2011 TaxID=1348973 RepID=A0A072NTP1_SCHAZ|nr:spore cortex-lytic enzyme [Schinkia azotoformans]KEF40567.1 spore cortex-lytic enzyme [Schinkia azotoformans MEV2011]MEC1696026.1 spore cortex-lytic enzyme [Schinkia azotoformans]MEC1716760.1 spore cortex-lytic enzyme [Schinkia azotoformans]MEC1725470.1 spore cortex-lytic enzyme [Schinkia azotoformans]MEC1739599.1 spore cortex-lytic enzyme [Schinkia azotoformans]
MYYKHLVKYLLMLTLLVGIAASTSNEEKASAFSNQIIQIGAVGDDVIELQARLQYLGFYHGKIDGVFGWGTYWALRNFQSEFGMPIDGLAGAATKQKLVNASKYDKALVKKNVDQGKSFTYYGGTPKEQQVKNDQPKQQQTAQKQASPSKPSAVNMPNGYSQNDIQLMANAVYGEARGEPYVGQVAVAAVILNRVNSPSFPNTISGVIFEPRAFTAVADGQIWLTPNETAKKAVIDAINGWDPTGNAIYYFNPNTATSAWIWSRPQVKQIGKHIFCM